MFKIILRPRNEQLLKDPDLPLHSVFGQISFPLPPQASYNAGISAIQSNP